MIMKKKIRQCLACPLCNNLFDCATTISECLHTFCRKCINDKLIEEDFKFCPVCNVDLGVAPLQKLRMDNSLDDMRLKLFPRKAKTAKKEEEQSLSLLFATLLGVYSSSSESSLDDEKVEAVPEVIKSSSKTISKSSNRRRKHTHKKEGGLGVSQGYIQKRKNSRKDNAKRAKKAKRSIENHDNFFSSCGETEERVEANQNTDFVSSHGDTEEVSSSVSRPQDDVIETENNVEGSNNEVRLSLIASEYHNGNITVSYVKKYLMKKLRLKSEDAVEIWPRHEPVCSTQRICNLVDWWVQTTPVSERRSMMVLFYSRSH
ncbi:unnamed protein product [Cochlearia groenlandica]